MNSKSKAKTGSNTEKGRKGRG